MPKNTYFTQKYTYWSKYLFLEGLPQKPCYAHITERRPAASQRVGQLLMAPPIVNPSKLQSIYNVHKMYILTKSWNEHSFYL